jgi:hypothetical protein
MGSGAFLVEACRQLGDALVEAWHVHGEVPAIPLDEDEVILARRLIAQRCLYGVDRNPVAVDLAKVSLWLVTLAKDHALTFVDHALRHGDSLVGLSGKQIEAFHWDPNAERFQMGFETMRVREHMGKVADLRRRIRDADEGFSDYELQDIWDEAQLELNKIRLFGDLVLAAYFAEEKPTDREVKRAEYASAVVSGEAERYRSWLEGWRHAEQPLAPFHWEVEFPEVFDRENQGFDAVVGNPPFLGGMKLSPMLGPTYLDHLYETTPGAGSRCDLIAYFLRRSFALLRNTGALGLVCTNTIAQGDTRTGGLEWLAKSGGHIYAATRRLKWPGEAAVVVAIVHIAKSAAVVRCVLDGRPVPKITPFLFPIGGESSPTRLSKNADQCFIGNNLLGMGFTFDDESSAATPLSVMRDIIAKYPECGKLIFPFIGGEEIVTSQTQKPHRYVINFGDMDLKQAREYQPLLSIVEERVLPGRKNKIGAYATKWWQFGRRNVAGQLALGKVQRALVSCQVSPFLSWAFQSSDIVFAHTLSIVVIDSYAAFCALSPAHTRSGRGSLGRRWKTGFATLRPTALTPFPFPRTGVATRFSKRPAGRTTSSAPRSWSETTRV